ncbi:MAG: DNA mismatch repair endonuclease MutL [Spirochaetes bacterium]|nr:DNA mismatch repair endonuclease MutL [Spirochaetota bacterium]MBU1081546.1 DNA mismatch repair endonuclease MutL [Spirochaetota bacterium]
MDASVIRVLEPEVAKRIAAGEVIDRPAAALRELLDNALDSGARSIAVEMDGGGADRLRVVDDGSGMGEADLALSVLPHATSKIRELDDLLSLSTLGFRGEALSSIAAVARLEIVSAVRDDAAWRLESEPGGRASIVPSKGSRGTAVTVRDLFASFPARKKFLKRPAAEAAACRAVLVDKAMAFPEVAFRLSSAAKPLLVLRPSGLVERTLAASAPDQPPEFFRELSASGTGFKARIVAGLPEVYRPDRRGVQVFVNGRRVQEYGIAQALEYSYRGALPGGAWPFAYAFVDVDPEFADFNIHPAKKEVRLKNIDEIRSGLIRAVRDYLGNRDRMASPLAALRSPGSGPAYGSELPGLEAAVLTGGPGYAEARERPYIGGIADRSSWPAMAEAAAKAREAPRRYGREAEGSEAEGREAASPRGDGFRYLGRALGVFLAFEQGDELVLLDQHAAHERYLYDEIMAGRAVSQELLVPVVFEPESDAEDAYIAASVPALAAAGFRLVREGRSWMLEAAPAMMPEAMTGAVFELLRSRPDPSELLRETAAQAACKAAIKDGDELDETGAVALIEAALRLPEPRCPHGRPIWHRMSREDLFRAVRRIV